MNPIHIESLNDPRLEPFVATTDRALQRQKGLFVVEGETILRRVLDCGVQLVSVLATPKRYEKLRDALPPDTQVLLLPNEQIEQVLGFSFHHGVLACGRRPKTLALDALVGKPRVVACPELHNADNLGLIVRTAAALGVDGVLVSEKGPRPYDRRTIRTSMGTVFSLPLVMVADVPGALGQLQRGGTELVATVCSDSAQPLASYRPSPEQPVCVLIGSEPVGLSPDLVGLCDHHLTIPMARDVDSLNAAVAAGIVLHHLCGTGGG